MRQARSLQRQLDAEAAWFTREQAKLAAESAQAVHELFQGVSALALVEDPGTWMSRFVAAVLPFRRRSRELAREYYRRVRALQGITGGFDLPEPPVWQEENALKASFAVHGPGRIDREIKKRPNADLNDPEFVKELDRIMQQSVNALAQDTARLTQNGGREAVHQATDSDEKAIGFYRQIKSANPCAFCIMLASRGVVYKSRRSARHGSYVGADGNAAYHRNCHCQPVPVFTRVIDGDEWTRKAEEAWKNGEIVLLESKNGKKYPAFQKGQS
ncbi:hypothetical protein [Streptomyces sp. NPDC127112]|uniref:VG15 protein n=1 Tax=Streptomyces sp. NPDC127112 TaxID=3345364 RepID=UPI0036294EAD